MPPIWNGNGGTTDPIIPTKLPCEYYGTCPPPDPDPPLDITGFWDSAFVKKYLPLAVVGLVLTRVK